MSVRAATLSSLLSREQARAVNRQLTDAKDGAEIHHIIVPHNPAAFDGVNISTSLHRLASFKVQLDNISVQLLCAEIAKRGKKHHLYNFTPQSLANCLCALVKIGITKESATVEVLIEEIADRMDTKEDRGQFDEQALANILWAIATLGINKRHDAVKGVIDEIALRAKDKHLSAKFIPKEISNILWALEKLGIDKEHRAVTRLMDEIVRRNAAGFNAQDVANCLSAFEKMGFDKDEPAVKVLINKTSTIAADEFIPQHIASILLTLAKIRIDREHHATEYLIDIIYKHKVAKFTPQQLDNCWLALGKMQVSKQNVAIQTLIAEIDARAKTHTLGIFEEQSISHILWAMEKIGFKKDHSAARALMAEIDLRGTAGFDTQGVATCLLALAKMGATKDDATIKALLVEALRQAAEFNSQDIANSLLACEKMGLYIADPTVKALITEIEERSKANKLTSFSPQSLANSLWAMVKMGLDIEFLVVKDLISAVQDLTPATQALITEICVRDKINSLVEFEPENISTCLWAMVKIGIDSQNDATKCLMVEITKRDLADFDPQSLVNSLSALATMGIPTENNAVKGLIAEMNRRARKKRLDKFYPNEIGNGLLALMNLAALNKDNVGYYLDFLQSDDEMFHTQDIERISQIIIFAHYCKLCLKININNYPNLQQFVADKEKLLPRKCFSLLHANVMHKISTEYNVAGIKFEREKPMCGFSMDEYFVLNGKQYYLEINGPFYFVPQYKLKGKLKRKILAAAGITVIDIDCPSGEFNKADMSGVQQIFGQRNATSTEFSVQAAAKAPILYAMGAKSAEATKKRAPDTAMPQPANKNARPAATTTRIRIPKKTAFCSRVVG